MICNYPAALGIIFQLALVIKQPAHRAPAIVIVVGTLEHPEELTDRCCLSALAGLSKYLPLLGAGGIIASQNHMSTLLGALLVFYLMFIKYIRKITVTVGHVDSWKTLIFRHTSAARGRLRHVEAYPHDPQPNQCSVKGPPLYTNPPSRSTKLIHNHMQLSTEDRHLSTSLC